MDVSYLVTPFFTWLVTGITKFFVNCFREKQFAFHLIGYGGMPSNHSAIVSSMAALIAMKEGLYHPAFGVALTVAFIVMLDANSLRKQIAKQAVAINKLNMENEQSTRLRERIGHSKLEIMCGSLLGILVAFGVFICL